MAPHPRSLAGILDNELAATQQPGPLPPCGADHHTEPGVTCQRVADHQTADPPRASAMLHAAKRLWHPEDTEPVWATWADLPPADAPAGGEPARTDPTQ